MKKILLISGKKGSGKSLIASVLYNYLKNEDIVVKKGAFATKLKEMLKPIFIQWDIDLEDRSQKELVRPIMTSLGQVAKQIDPYYWVKITYNDIISMPDNSVYIIEDWRFLSELEYLEKKMYDKNLNQSYELYTLRIESNGTDRDISEIQLDKYDKFNFKIASNEIVANNIIKQENLHSFVSYLARFFE